MAAAVFALGFAIRLCGAVVGAPSCRKESLRKDSAQLSPARWGWQPKCPAGLAVQNE